MPRSPHLRDSVVTIGSNCLHNHGLNLFCLDCHHHAAWTPADVAAVERPARSLWDFKRRRRCSRCGTGGSTDRVQLTVSVMGVGSADRTPRPTAPQLWGR